MQPEAVAGEQENQNGESRKHEDGNQGGNHQDCHPLREAATEGDLRNDRPAVRDAILCVIANKHEILKVLIRA